MELRFVNGHWEINEGAGWHIVDAVDAQFLAGFDAISPEGIISGPAGTTTLDQFLAASNPIPDDSGLSEGAGADLSWWPPILPKFKPIINLGTVTWVAYSPSEVADVFQATMVGELPNEHLDGTKWEAERDKRTAALGAPETLSTLFDSSGNPIAGKGIRANGDIVTFNPPITTETTGFPGITTVTPVIDPNTGLATDFVIVAVPGEPPKYLKASQAPEPPTIADLLNEAVVNGEFDYARELGRIINQPQTTGALITAELEKNTAAGNARAQQIFDFANQTTKEAAMQFALEVAKSPADTLAWSALVRGDLRAGETGALSTTGVQKIPFVESAFDAIQEEQAAAAALATTPKPADQPPVPVAADAAFDPNAVSQQLFGEGFQPQTGIGASSPAPVQQPNIPAGEGFGPAADVAPPRPAISIAPQINQQPDTGLDAAQVSFTQAGSPGQAPAPAGVPATLAQQVLKFGKVPPTPSLLGAPNVSPTGGQTGEDVLAAPGTPPPAAVAGEPEFKPFGQVETVAGGFEDIRVAPRVSDVALGRTISRPDFNTAFQQIGLAIGVGPNFRPPSFDQFNRLSPTEQEQLLGAGELVGISREEFFAAMSAATPGGFAQGLAPLGIGGLRGLV